jgi:hypothetical protein
MRLLFGFFLLLNVAYFVWQMGYLNPVTPTIIQEPSLPEGVKRLTLLRERGLGQSAASAPAPRTPQSSVPESAQEEAAPKGADAVEEALSEIQQAPVPVVTEPVPEPEPIPAPKPVEPVQMACFTLGPFEKEAMINKAAEAISALDVSTSQRQSELKTPKSYWVYLPQDSYSAARETVKTLKSKGLRDLFIMGKGANKDAVSLGLFSNKKTARQRIVEVRRLGFDPIEETQYRVTTQHWLDLEVDSKRTSTVATITAIAEDHKGTALTQHQCE